MDYNFKPKDLDDALQHLLAFDEIVNVLNKYGNDEPGFLSELHFSLGMDIRNSWKLW